MKINLYKYSSNSLEFIPILLINPMTKVYYVSWVYDNIDSEYKISLGVFKGKLILLEIKDTILEDINKNIDSKILEGYTWKDYLVWLSLENLFNYKAAYDIATQSNGTIGLPVTFKFTDPTTQNPIYYTFITLEELQDFYLGAVNHINKTLEEGWRLKDTFDFSPYEEWLLAHDNSN